MFTAEYPQKLYKNPKPHQVDANGKLLSFPERCSEAMGMDAKEASRLKMSQLSELLKSHFIMKVFDGDVTRYHDADCFQAKKQSIDRKRKPSKAAKDKAKTVKKAGGRMKKQRSARSHKHAMNVQVRCCYNSYCCCLTYLLICICFMCHRKPSVSLGIVVFMHRDATGLFVVVATINACMDGNSTGSSVMWMDQHIRR